LKVFAHILQRLPDASKQTEMAVSKELMPRDAYYKAAQDMMEQVKREMRK
jgi:hypothetical protein